MNLRNVAVLFFIPLLFLFQLYIYYYEKDLLWLVYNTQSLNGTSLSWIYNSWGVIIGVHGTTAALTITFMGMIFESVSKNSPIELEDFSRQQVIGKLNVLNFSCDSLFTLIVSIFFFIIGGGVAHYIVSQFLALWFFVSYFKAYKRVFDISKNKNYIFDYIENESSLFCKSFAKKESNYERINSDLNEIIKGDKGVYFSGGSYNHSFIGGANISTLPVNSSGELCDFRREKLIKLINFVGCIKKNNDSSVFEVVVPRLTLFGNYGVDGIKVIYSSEFENSPVKKKTERLASKLFFSSRQESGVGAYLSLVNGVCSYLVSSINVGDKNKINKSIELFSLLIGNEYSRYPFDCLKTIANEFLRGSNVKPYSLGLVLKKIYILSGKDDCEELAFSTIIDMALVSLSNEGFYEFLVENESRINEIISYSSNNQKYYDVLLYLIKDACNNLNFSVLHFWGKFFGQDSEHLSIKYLTLDGDKDGVIEKILEMQRLVITTMIMRYDSVIKNDRTSSEYNDVIEIIGKWVNLSFVSNEYFNPKLYQVLFLVYKKDYQFKLDEQNIRNLNRGDAYGVTESSFKIKSLVFILLFGEACNSGSNMSLKFLYNIKEASFISEFRSYDFEKMKAAVDSSSIEEIILSLGADEKILEKSKVDLKSYVSEFEKIKKEEVVDAIQHAIIKKELVEKLEGEINSYFSNWLARKFSVQTSNLVVDGKLRVLPLLVEKRQFIEPLDGVSYILSGNVYGEYLCNYFNGILIRSLRVTQDNVVNINKVDDFLKEGGYILIFNKKNGVTFPYTLYKGVSFFINTNYSKLEQGVYFVPKRNIILSRVVSAECSVYIGVNENSEKTIPDNQHEEFKVKLNIYPNLNIKTVNIEEVRFISLESALRFYG